jgi:predicted ATPase
MSKIKIKNFGPVISGCIDDDGWIDIKKVTAFIGNQGSGKSTVAKLISTFTWMEKALVRGDYDKEWFEKKNIFRSQFLTYHRLEGYESPDTMIEYKGDTYSFKYERSWLAIKEIGLKYPLPQIMYVPAERNFIAYVKTPNELRLSSDALKEFLTEFTNARDEMEDSIPLPINGTELQYDATKDAIFLFGRAHKVLLTHASSGFQSFVPLFLVSDFLSKKINKQSKVNSEPMSNEESQRFIKNAKDIIDDENLTNEQKRALISALSSKFNKTAFINIVEEPEQNLFPDSQWEILKSLLGFNNMNSGNKLILTTHSPYIINYLSIAIQGAYLKEKIMANRKGDELLSKLYTLVPEKALSPANDVVVYELNEKNGSIKKLAAPEGIPSDNNYLNNLLRTGNELFDALLAIEEEI